MVCQKTEQCCRHTLLGLAPGQQRTHLNMLYPPPITDANAFQDISTFQQYHPFADFASTALTHQKGVTGLTHDDKSCTWARWEEYFLAARCQDIFTEERILLLEAFVMAVRSRRFSDSQFNTLVEATGRGIISNVVQTFRSLGRQNPTRDADSELRILLSRQF